MRSSSDACDSSQGKIESRMNIWRKNLNRLQTASSPMSKRWPLFKFNVVGFHAPSTTIEYNTVLYTNRLESYRNTSLVFTHFPRLNGNKRAGSVCLACHLKGAPFLTRYDWEIDVLPGERTRKNRNSKNSTYLLQQNVASREIAGLDKDL